MLQIFSGITASELERRLYAVGAADAAAIVAAGIDATEDHKRETARLETEIEEANARTLDVTRAWEYLFDAWRDSLADGGWPGASPEDEHLQSVMARDIEKAGEERQWLRELLAEIQAAEDVPDWLKSRADQIRDWAAEE